VSFIAAAITYEVLRGAAAVCCDTTHAIRRTERACVRAARFLLVRHFGKALRS
jgi:hypothetical protein